MDLSTFIEVLGNFKRKTSNIKNISLEELLKIYKDITVFIYKTMPKYSNEVAYPAQNMQLKIENEIKERINKN